VSPSVLSRRYALFDVIGAGGTASVHLGQLRGAAGFSRVVAIKRLHPMYARDAGFVAMLLDEARLASRISHPNVVQVLDVVAEEGELFVVMDYIAGESLAQLLVAARQAGERVPTPIATSIAVGMLYGLHAAHEARSAGGEPLHIVHRDVSPHNVLVGVDGTVRVTDFGIAKASARAQSTGTGQIKGKLRYMAPEQLAGRGLNRKTDLWAASVVLWETLTAQRLFGGTDEGVVYGRVMEGVIAPPSQIAPDVPAVLDEIVLKGLKRNPEERFATAAEMATALQRSLPVASAIEVGEWVSRLAKDVLAARERKIGQSPSQTAPVEDAPFTKTRFSSVPPAPGSTGPRRRSRTLIFGALGLGLSAAALLVVMTARTHGMPRGDGVGANALRAEPPSPSVPVVAPAPDTVTQVGAPDGGGPDLQTAVTPPARAAPARVPTKAVRPNRARSDPFTKQY
jgi:eukaryotic-like serine/threonine-protein kinase